MKQVSPKIKALIFVTTSAVVLSWLFIGLNAQVVRKSSDNKKESLQEFQITAQTTGDKTMFKLGDHIPLGLTVTNNSSMEIYVVESYAERDYKIEVKNEIGQDIPLTKIGKRLTDPATPVWRIKKVKIDPGKSIQSNIDIAALYDMSVAGVYSISISRTAKKADGKLIRAATNIQIAVG